MTAIERKELELALKPLLAAATADDRDAYLDRSDALHDIIHRGCHNPFLTELVRAYRHGRRLDLFPRCPVILVDDGLGSGLAHLAAIRALRHFHPHATVVATPAGAEVALACVEHYVGTLVCLEHTTHASHMPWGFGGDPAERWAYPIGETEAAEVLARLR